MYFNSAPTKFTNLISLLKKVVENRAPIRDVTVTELNQLYAAPNKALLFADSDSEPARQYMFLANNMRNIQQGGVQLSALGQTPLHASSVGGLSRQASSVGGALGSDPEPIIGPANAIKGLAEIRNEVETLKKNMKKIFMLTILKVVIYVKQMILMDFGLLMILMILKKII